MMQRQDTVPQVNSTPVKSFKIGDKAVYPAHGVGEVTAIEDREISGMSQTFYILRILDNGLQIMIPTNNIRQVGLREVIGADMVEQVFGILRQKGLSVDTTTWNRRYREYMEKIKTGSVFEVAEVLRDLYLLKTDKDLSFCELKLLDTARGLLIKELAVAKNCDEEEVEREFKVIFNF
jgi:CarD family transcriptional regulator